MDSVEEPATSAGTSSAQTTRRLLAANKKYRVVGTSVIGVLLLAGFASAYALDNTNQQHDNAVVETAPVFKETHHKTPETPEVSQPEKAEPKTSKDERAEGNSSFSYSQKSANGSTETKVYVNGERITVPKNSSTQKTITNENGSKTHISVQNSSSGTNVQSSGGANSFINVQSHSYTQTTTDDYDP